MESTIIVAPRLAIPLNEIAFAVSRSGGPGGQHVNKTETRVELSFDVKRSTSLTEHQREKISHALANRIDRNGVLRLAVSQERSQYQNKQIAIARLVRLIGLALRPVKKRIPTKPGAMSREERLRAKKIAGEKKLRRRAPSADSEE